MKKFILVFLLGFTVSLLGSFLSGDSETPEFLMLTMGPLIFFCLSGFCLAFASNKDNQLNYYGGAVTFFGVGIYFCVLLNNYLQK